MATNVVDSAGLVVTTSTTGAGMNVIRPNLHVATDMSTALDVATKNTSTSMDSITSVEINLDTLHVATDSLTNDSRNCLPGNMSVLADNEASSENISNVENIP